MYKIHIKGNIFYIDDLTTNLRYEAHAKDVLARVLTINSEDFSFNNVNNWSDNKVIKFSEIDLSEADYTDVASFIAWTENELGKSSPSDGGGVPPDLSDYVTINTPQTIKERKEFAKKIIVKKSAESDVGGLIQLINTIDSRLRNHQNAIEFLSGGLSNDGIRILSDAQSTYGNNVDLKFQVQKNGGGWVTVATVKHTGDFFIGDKKALHEGTPNVWLGDNESLSRNIDGIYDLDDLNVTGSYRPAKTDAGLPFNLHSQVAHYAHPYTNNFAFQIATPYSSNRMFFRNKRNGNWYDWSEIYHTKNAHRTTNLDDPSTADLNRLFPLAENPVGVQVVCTGGRKSLYVRTGDTEWRFTELRLVS